MLSKHTQDAAQFFKAALYPPPHTSNTHQTNPVAPVSRTPVINESWSSWADNQSSTSNAVSTEPRVGTSGTLPWMITFPDGLTLDITASVNNSIAPSSPSNASSTSGDESGLASISSSQRHISRHASPYLRATTTSEAISIHAGHYSALEKVNKPGKYATGVCFSATTCTETDRKTRSL